MLVMKKHEPYTFPFSKYEKSAAEWALGRRVSPATVNELVMQVQLLMAQDPKLSRHQAILDALGAEDARMGSAITTGAARHRAEVMAKLDSILELWVSQQASEVVL